MTDDLGLALERIAAFAGVTFPAGSPHKRFARQMAHATAEMLTPRQVAHVAHLAWRYRRQMPPHLVPPADPYAGQRAPAQARRMKVLGEPGDSSAAPTAARTAQFDFLTLLRPKT